MLTRTCLITILSAALLGGQQPAAAAESHGAWARWFGGGGAESQQHVLSRPAAATLEPASSPSAVSYVALGDSYSAGIGTGFTGKETDCRLGDGAYPNLISAGLNGTPAADVAFQWRSCTGSTTDDMLAGGGRPSQVEAADLLSTAALATLSVGGNDALFFNVLNACLFRFYGPQSGGCDDALARSEKALAAPDLAHRLLVLLLQILDRAGWEQRRRGFALVVTGYARFFAPATPPACDQTSLAVWWGDAGAPHLTAALRARINGLVADANAVLRRAVARAAARRGSRSVIFVDYDAAFDGHRLCEDGVDEPDYARNATWFFLPGGPDSSGPNGTVPSPPPPPNATAVAADGVLPLPPGSPLVDPATCLSAARARGGDWGELALCYMAMAKARYPELRPAAHLAGGGLSAQNSMWYVPTYYGKTFHPVSCLSPARVRDKA